MLYCPPYKSCGGDPPGRGGWRCPEQQLLPQRAPRHKHSHPEVPSSSQKRGSEARGLHPSSPSRPPILTSAQRGRSAPLAVHPVPGGAEDGSLSLQRVAGLAAVGDRRAVVKFVQQPPRVLPVGNVGRGRAGDTCSSAERAC